MEASNEELKRLENNFAGNGNTATNKRIIKEYSALIGNPGYRVDFENGSNIYVWVIGFDVSNWEFSRELMEDFNLYERTLNRKKEVVFEVRFSSSYPASPPFIRVVRPKFVFRTAHITIGGSICTQSLTPSGWLRDRTIESLFNEIFININDGGARLDRNSFKIDYTLSEAQSAFTRVANYHRWL
jgi:ubiquitin-conjugating enzyme E2 Q